MEKLNVKAMTIAGGAAWAFCILFAGWAAIFGWATKFVEVMNSVYIGYEPTLIGGIIGALWGFLDGAIVGFIIAVVYNAVIKKR